MRTLLIEISGCVGLLGLSIVSASGEALVNDAIERYRLGDPGMFTFLTGNVNALIWVNNDLKSNGHTELFCVPPSTTLGVQEVINMMSKHIKENPSDGQRPVGSVILQSLKESFPCK